MLAKPLKPNSAGLIACACYAFMPNQLGLCGNNKNKELLDYASAKQSDPRLQSLLSDFATMHPYLKLIAKANKIRDPFDERVVSSYWLGNDLLYQVKKKELYEHFLQGLGLVKKFNPKLLKKTINLIPRGAIAHHNFHVFNMPKRTGHYPIEPCLEAMDKCRISWGKITKIMPEYLIIKTQPLIVKNEKIELGKQIEKKIRYKLTDKGFISQPQIGDTVSVHWDWACEKLSLPQLKNLKIFTRVSLLNN